MTNRRSHLDTLNAGRPRRTYASLEDLNRSLETLENRLDRNRAEAFDPPRQPIAPRAQPAAEARPDSRPYQRIAADLERLRGQEDGVAAFGTIVGELRALREDMRSHFGSSVRREFELLRSDLEAASTSAAGLADSRLGVEFERLAVAITALAERGDESEIPALRAEVQRLAEAMRDVAREDTVKSSDSRWEVLGRRFDTFEQRLTATVQSSRGDDAIAAVTRRLDAIGTALASLPESIPLETLEGRIETLSGALERFMAQGRESGGAAHDQVVERLDEIARAIVAAQTPGFDIKAIERIETRIASLARQVEEVSAERLLDAVAPRLDQLSGRVESVAERIEHGQAAATRDSGTILEAIDTRFTQLAEHFDGAARFDEKAIREAIDARFAQLASRMEGSPRDDAALRQMEARLLSIAERLDPESTQFAGVDPALVRNLESQVAWMSENMSRPLAPMPELEAIGPRLAEIERSIAESRETILDAAREAAEQAAKSIATGPAETAAVAGLSGDLRSLEELTRKSDERNSKTFEAIHDTLLKIVGRIATLQDAPASGPAKAAQQQPVEATPEPAQMPRAKLTDLPSLDDAPQAIDDIASETILAEPITATHRPPAARDRTPAQAAHDAALAAIDEQRDAPAPAATKRSILSSFSLRRARKDVVEDKASAPAAAVLSEPAPMVELDAPLDPRAANTPLEPGSGTPDLNAIMKRVRDERGQPVKHADTDAAKSDFIAAARRAAKAAAAEAEVMKKKTGDLGPTRALRIGDILKSRRRPLLMGTAAIMLALAGTQLGKAYLGESGDASTDARPQDISAAPLADIDTGTVGSTERPARAVAERIASAPGRDVTAPAAAPVQTPPRSAAAATIAPAAAATEVTVLDEPVSPMTERIQALTAPAKAMAAAPTIPETIGPKPLIDAASGGDAKAMFEVASRFAEGHGAPADMAAAASFYEKSAALGLAPAQYRIGSFYEKGVGVARSSQAARGWYEKAAAQGNASAMHNLAVQYAMGADGKPDNKQAAKWFDAAAELGVKDSQFNLGILSAKGVGMPQDLEASYKWFALVAKAGDKDAAAKRDEIAASLTPDQLDRAKASADLWKAKPLDPAANAVSVPAAWIGGEEKVAQLDMKAAIRNIQLILNKNGYDAGQADGVIGNRTKVAIATFQKDNGMSATGTIDETLVRTLLDRK